MHFPLLPDHLVLTTACTTTISASSPLKSSAFHIVHLGPLIHSHPYTFPERTNSPSLVPARCSSITNTMRIILCLSGHATLNFPNVTLSPFLFHLHRAPPISLWGVPPCTWAGWRLLSLWPTLPFPVPVWPSAPGVGIGAVIPGPIGGSLYLSTGA